MKQRRKLFIVLLFLLLFLLALALIVRSLVITNRSNFLSTDPSISNFASGGILDTTGNNNGSSGGYSPLILNVSECQLGRDAVYFGLGHTEFLVLSKSDNKCIFEHGTEIENPNWDGELDTSCSVPSTQNITLVAGDQGINFRPIEQYCTRKS
jgi:hypothetical protein